MRFSSRNPFVSVIIPAYNAHDIIVPCLQSLSRQSYPASDYEIIVVDNGSTSSLAPIVESFEKAICLYEAKPGSYAARNRALQEARGEVLAFTDADCIPASDWIERGVEELYKAPDAGLIGGHIQLAFKISDTPTVMELCDYLSFGGFPQRDYVEKCNFGATANVFTTREVMNNVGEFNENQLSGGDLQWGNRVAKAGYKLVFGAEVIVLHPARNQFRELVKKARRLQGGAHDTRDQPLPPEEKARYSPTMRRLIGFIRDDYKRFKANRRLSGQLMRYSKLTAAGALTVVWLLRFIRRGERLRLYLGGKSFRG